MTKDIQTIQHEIIKKFSIFNDWFDTYECIINKGKSFESIDESIRTDENFIGGCQSAVWITAEMKNETIRYKADSDSLIIKGILSLLLEVINGQQPLTVLNADLYFLEKIGLQTNLSPSRVNGLNAIVEQIKSIAKNHLNDDIAKK